jgi:hypothetical protein
MEDLNSQIAQAAEHAVALGRARSNDFDYSEASLVAVEAMLAEASHWVGGMLAEQQTTLVQNFGCYILEVGRRAFGGRYQWHNQHNQPVLVVGEPTFRVAIMTWDKVRGRLNGDTADNIPFFYQGFAQRARLAEPGTDMLYV